MLLPVNPKKAPKNAIGAILWLDKNLAGLLLTNCAEVSSIVRRVGLVPVSGGTDKRTSGLGALALLTW